ncbi:MAG: pyridoxamine 5'-phosphate oxidase family protein [Clostridia bacterium]|nr:pyridoxamine 5'-phosphate oxidase family protein [Clostridia bacterium]
MTPGLTRREREITDINETLKILDKSKIVHIGLVDGDEPYVVPMNYGYTYENDALTLYLHGATEGKKLDLMRANPKVFFSIECDVEPFSGQVACQYGTSYSSVMGKGFAEILEAPEDKMEGLTLFMKTQTGIDFEFNERLVSAVSVIKINVTSFTAKHRPKPINA